MKNENNLRHRLGGGDSYASYCREERNFAAVLYHLLLNDKRMGAFLQLIGLPPEDAREAKVYFEYAQLRDLWAEVASQEKEVEARNQRYRDAIISMLERPDVALPTDCKKFNEFFIGRGSKAASANYIQMPSRWNDSQFLEWCKSGDRAFAERACMLKWAFNAKPDLVLHFGHDKAVCVEAKLESGVGAYQVRTDHPLGRFNMSQTKLQEFILQNLLGYTTDFVMVSKNQKGEIEAPWRRYTWHEVFEAVLSEPSESRMVAEFRKSRFIQSA